MYLVLVEAAQAMLRTQLALNMYVSVLFSSLRPMHNPQYLGITANKRIEPRFPSTEFSVRVNGRSG